MKTKILYVLTSNENDCYMEQFYVSVYSLKKKTPSAHVVLLTDTDTKESFKSDKRRYILDYLDECVVLDPPKLLDRVLRSRYLKTKMREVVQGDFLYIDCDTIINDDLSSVDEFDCLIGAVPDAHSIVSEHPVRDMFAVDNSKVEMDILREDYYYNGGVFYVKDCEKTRNFFDMWHKEWTKGVARGVWADMPSLAKTNHLYGNIITKVPDIWNCQLVFGLAFYKNAKILHYFSSGFARFKTKYPFFFQSKDVFRAIKNNGLTQDIIEKIDNPFEAFNSPVEILAGKELDFLHSPVVIICRRLYYNHPKMFNFICKVYFFFYKRRK